MGYGRSIWATLMLLATLVSVLLLALESKRAYSAEERPAASFLKLEVARDCDSLNRDYVLINTHEFRTIAATVRWKAEGGKELTDRFYPSPQSSEIIGCAFTADILDATFVNF